MRLGVRTLGDYTQATAPERVLLAVWQACGSTEEFGLAEGRATVSQTLGEGGRSLCQALV